MVNNPIDGTKEYIAGKDEYALNAALVIDTVPVLGLVGVPKKNRLFYIRTWRDLFGGVRKNEEN